MGERRSPGGREPFPSATQEPRQEETVIRRVPEGFIEHETATDEPTSRGDLIDRLDGPTDPSLESTGLDMPTEDQGLIQAGISVPTTPEVKSQTVVESEGVPLEERTVVGRVGGKVLVDSNLGDGTAILGRTIKKEEDVALFDRMVKAGFSYEQKADLLGQYPIDLLENILRENNLSPVRSIEPGVFVPTVFIKKYVSEYRKKEREGGIGDTSTLIGIPTKAKQPTKNRFGFITKFFKKTE